MITIDVHGIPAPQGSKRHVGHGVMVESSTKVKPWREAVRSQVQAALEKGVDPLPKGMPVAVQIIFCLPRPKSHYRTGRNAHLLRDDAPRTHVATRPDLDKLIRSTLDGLTSGGLYVDDSQVVDIGSAKRYADGRPVGAEITVWRFA